jgi:AraC-like DNA-binding protein
MSLSYEERPSDSPYLETVTYGLTTSDGWSVRPAETSWHMVFVRHNGCARVMLVGPWRAAGVTSWGEGAEILWLKFRLGTFMPRRPALDFRDSETVMPLATRRSFWLDDSAWQVPDFDDADAFVDRFARNGVLVRDPVVQRALEGDVHTVSPRTLRHRFLWATGLTQRHSGQVERAQRAATLLRQGATIADTVFEAGYFDQPHLTRSLKRFIGYTPAQLIGTQTPEPLAVSYKTVHPGKVYPGEVASKR